MQLSTLAFTHSFVKWNEKVLLNCRLTRCCRCCLQCETCQWRATSSKKGRDVVQSSLSARKWAPDPPLRADLVNINTEQATRLWVICKYLSGTFIHWAIFLFRADCVVVITLEATKGPPRGHTVMLWWLWIILIYKQLPHIPNSVLFVLEMSNNRWERAKTKAVCAVTLRLKGQLCWGDVTNI